MRSSAGCGLISLGNKRQQMHKELAEADRCGLISLGNKRQHNSGATEREVCCGLISLGNKRQLSLSTASRLSQLWIDQFRE